MTEIVAAASLVAAERESLFGSWTMRRNPSRSPKVDHSGRPKVGTSVNDADLTAISLSEWPNFDGTHTAFLRHCRRRTSKSPGTTKIR